VTLVRQRWCRALLVCTTCKVVVATGPTCEREPLAAFELGRLATVTESILHLGICAGGVLDVQLEEVPNPPPGEQLSLPAPATPGAAAAADRELRIVYDDDEGSDS